MGDLQLLRRKLASEPDFVSANCCRNCLHLRCPEPWVKQMRRHGFFKRRISGAGAACVPQLGSPRDYGWRCPFSEPTGWI